MKVKPGMESTLRIRKHAALIFATASMCLAQTATTPGPLFEVASVKPAARGEINGAYTFPGGRVELRGCTFQYLMQVAFDVQEFQVAGVADWMQNARYDIDAKVPATSKSSQANPPNRKMPMNPEQRRMLQALLAERFGLTYHRETRDGAVYLLVRNGKALKMTDAKDKNAFPWSGGLRGGMLSGDGMAGTNESMPDLAKRLSWYVQRTVLDRTGLSGSYDFRTAYSQDDAHPDVVGLITTCLNDLGLKLEASKGPVEKIVIDKAQKASAN
jgi:uncharacterized protein (TIGR03435 family)